MTKKRKRTGWMMGSFGIVSFFICLIGVVGSSVLTKVLFDIMNGLASEGDPAPGVIFSYIVMVSIIFIVIFVIGCLISLIKVVGAVLIHKGRSKTSVVVIMGVGAGASLIMFLIFLGMTTLLFSIVGVVFILAMMLDLAIWGYLIYSVTRSWDTFKSVKREKLQVSYN